MSSGRNLTAKSWSCFPTALTPPARILEVETIQVAKESETTIYSIQFDTRNQMLMPRQAPLQHRARSRGGSPFPWECRLPFPAPSPWQGPGRSQVEAEYGRGRAYLKQLASVTGGDLYQASQDLLNLSTIFAQIAEEMRSLYSISYVSSNSRRDGKFRKIAVRVDVPDARVRTRKGYKVARVIDGMQMSVVLTSTERPDLHR